MKIRLALGVVLALVVAACGGGTPGSEEPRAPEAAESPSRDGVDTPAEAEAPETGKAPSPAEGPSIWVAANEGYTLLRYDTSLDLVDRIDEYVGDVDLSLTVGYVLFDGKLWFEYSDETNQLIAVDPDGYEIVSRVDLPDYPLHVTVGAGRIWVTYYDSATITEVFPDGTSEELTVEGLPNRVVDVGERGWLVDALENRLYDFDPANGRVGGVVAEIPTSTPYATVEIGDTLWLALDDSVDVLARVSLGDGTVNRIWCDQASGECQALPDDLFATAELEGGAIWGVDMVEIDGKLMVAGSGLLAFESVDLYLLDPDGLTIEKRIEVPPVEGMARIGDDVLLLVYPYDTEACGILMLVDANLDVVDQTELPDDVCPDALDVG